MASTIVRPNGTLSSTFSSVVGAATAHEATDDPVDSSDEDTSYILGDNGQTVKLQLDNMPSDFVSASAVNIRLRAYREGAVKDGFAAYISGMFVAESDGTTAITATVSDIAMALSYDTYSSSPSITGNNNKTVWDGAVIVISINSPDSKLVHISSVELVITYTAGAVAATSSKVHKILLGGHR